MDTTTDQAGSDLPIIQNNGKFKVNLSPQQAREILSKNPGQLISNIIEEKYGKAISEIKQEVIPVLLSRDQAHQLKSKEGEPALRIIRSYLDTANEVFEVTVTIHPADRYTFITKLRRDTTVS